MPCENHGENKRHTYFLKCARKRLHDRGSGRVSGRDARRSSHHDVIVQSTIRFYPHHCGTTGTGVQRPMDKRKSSKLNDGWEKVSWYLKWQSTIYHPRHRRMSAMHPLDKYIRKFMYSYWYSENYIVQWYLEQPKPPSSPTLMRDIPCIQLIP